MFKFLIGLLGTKKKSEFEEDLESDKVFVAGQLNRYSRPHICCKHETPTKPANHTETKGDNDEN